MPVHTSAPPPLRSGAVAPRIPSWAQLSASLLARLPAPPVRNQNAALVSEGPNTRLLKLARCTQKEAAGSAFAYYGREKRQLHHIGSNREAREPANAFTRLERASLCTYQVRKNDCDAPALPSEAMLQNGCQMQSVLEHRAMRDARTAEEADAPPKLPPLSAQRPI